MQAEGRVHIFKRKVAAVVSHGKVAIFFTVDIPKLFFPLFIAMDKLLPSFQDKLLLFTGFQRLLFIGDRLFFAVCAHHVIVDDNGLAVHRFFNDLYGGKIVGPVGKYVLDRRGGKIALHMPLSHLVYVKDAWGVGQVQKLLHKLFHILRRHPGSAQRNIDIGRRQQILHVFADEADVIVKQAIIFFAGCHGHL